MVLENKNNYSSSIKFLQGKRWGNSANETYVMPADEYHRKFDGGDTNSIASVVQYFVQKHSTHDALRITALQRYYLGDNDIHYWINDKRAKGRADNRIASGFAKFITNMRVGYMLGKPIQFKPVDDNVDQDIQGMIDSFNRENDERYHEKVMKTNLSTTGRAYELLYAGQSVQDKDGNYQTPEVKLRAIDPATAFVVYDTSIERHSLFGVRYYMVDYNDEQKYYIDVYTADTTYHYKSDTGNMASDGNYELISKESTSFGAVPLTEYINNENRTGDWEAKLDEIDAYDLAMSEMANSEEDFANAKLALSGDIDFSDRKRPVLDNKGNPMTNDDGSPIYVPVVDTKDPYIMLKPSVIPNPSGGNTVIDSKAEYLTKQLDVTGWETYVNHLTNDIHKDTNTPNTTDEAFSGQSSGVALMYKLFGEDQERSMQESLYTRGLMRRLRLLGNFWKENREIGDPSIMNQIMPHYTPNLPRNNADIVAMVVQLNNTGLISDETLRELISSVTGVSSDAENERIEDQKQQEEPGQFDGAPLQGVNPADLAEAQRKLQSQGQQPQQPKSAEDLVLKLQRGELGGNNAQS